jgi:flagellar biosynthetic protein FliQ
LAGLSGATGVGRQQKKRQEEMTPQDAIDLGRQAIWTTLLIGAPVLVAGMIVGLVIGLLQALTQIQEQTVSFVPKIVAMILVLSFVLPWLITHMLEYSQQLIGGIPGTL